MTDARDRLFPFPPCDGPHEGLCLVRAIRVLRDPDNEPAPSSRGRVISTADVSRRVQQMGLRLEDLGCHVSQGLACARARPFYDRQRRELWVGAACVLRFVRAAWNQIAVLEMFEAQGWPARIEDPLGKKMGAAYVERLKTTAFRLNDGQTPRLILFHAQAIERVISWEFTPVGPEGSDQESC